MVITNDAAAALEPFDVDAVRNISSEPHQKDQHDAERERKAQIVMYVFGPLRPGREGFTAKGPGEQRPTKGDVETGDRQDDEASCSHPMHEPLERGETDHGAAGAATLDAHHAAPEIKANQ